MKWLINDEQLQKGYHNAIAVLHRCSSDIGFLASSENKDNYRRVWARDGVVCGLAALASKDQTLIATFKKTLQTLGDFQHDLGIIPSNVYFSDGQPKISYGGLVGRTDTTCWYLLGLALYVQETNDWAFLEETQPIIQKALRLLDTWEYNTGGLLYVPLSGNWADEYIVEGYVLFDQVLRLWGLSALQQLQPAADLKSKIAQIRTKIYDNFIQLDEAKSLHPRTFSMVTTQEYVPACFSPAGYKNYFDAFGTAILLFTDLVPTNRAEKMADFVSSLTQETKTKLVPAFWPPVFETDAEYRLLSENHKYEFRNAAYEYHNAGSWCMVNGFAGVALAQHGKVAEATTLLKAVNEANSLGENGFYEHHHSLTAEPKGTRYCAWSAAGQVLLTQSLNQELSWKF